MVYTVTFNPSLDYFVDVPDFRTGEVCRAETGVIRAGGKGINVSLVLSLLGVKSFATGFVSGFTGREICRLLSDSGIGCDFAEIPGGMSRINVKIRHGMETEINGSGPSVGEKEKKLLEEKLSRVKKGDFAVFSGSIPKGTEASSYADIIASFEEGVNTVVDAEGEILLKTLPLKPFLIKPNRSEAERILGRKISSPDQALDCAEIFRANGSRNVIVSLGADGAVFSAEDGKGYIAGIPSGKTVNTVGSGDSTVAGFISACIKGMTPDDAFAFAVATGTAAAYKEGFPDETDIRKVLKGVTFIRRR